MYCASSKEGTVWCSVCDPVAQCILPNTKPTPGPQQICWKLASWTPAKPICWHILTHWSDGKWGGVVKNLIFRIGKMMINHRVSCAIFAIKPFWLLIKTNMLWFSHQHGLIMFDCIKAQPQIYGIIHRPWPIPRISHCSLLISKRNPSRLFGVYSTTGRAVAPGLFHHRATVVIWGHNPPHRPPTVPVQW